MPQGYKCKMGRAILSLGILGVIMSVKSVEAVVPGGVVKTANGGLQGKLENVAQGEERQAEMEKMNRNISGRHAELTEVVKNIKRRQILLEITSREVEESMLRLAEEKKRMEEVRTRDEGLGNCTESPAHLERLKEKGVKVSGLKVMGVFTLCEVLATLGWEGVTGAVVATARAWPPRESACNGDTSTSMSELRPGEGKLPPRSSALKFLRREARMEWARRRTPPSRRLQSPAR